MDNSRRINLGYFLGIIFFLIIFMQFFGLFRITVTFNSSLFSLPLQFGLVLSALWFYIKSGGRLKLSSLEMILMVTPFVMIPWGLYNNPLDRHIFSEPILIAMFFMTVSVFRSAEITSSLWRRGALWMYYGLGLFLLLTLVVRELGVPIFSIAKTSIYFVYPCFFFYFFREKKKFFVSVLLIVLSTKRSLLFALPLSFVLYFFMSNRFKYQSKFYVGIPMAISFLCVVFFLSQPKIAEEFPGHMGTLVYKMAKLNPLSDTFNISENYRISEVKASYDQSMLNFENFIFGQGPGFAYDVYKENGDLWFEKVHNTHFTFMSLWSKYGLIYMALFVIYLLQTIYRSSLVVRSQLSSPLTWTLFCFFISSLFEVLTSYSLFINMLNAVAMGQLLNRYDENRNHTS